MLAFDGSSTEPSILSDKGTGTSSTPTNDGIDPSPSSSLALQNSRRNTGVIVGSVIGVLVFFILLLLAILYFPRRRRTRKQLGQSHYQAQPWPYSFTGVGQLDAWQRNVRGSNTTNQPSLPATRPDAAPRASREGRRLEELNGNEYPSSVSNSHAPVPTSPTQGAIAQNPSNPLVVLSQQPPSTEELAAYFSDDRDSRLDALENQISDLDRPQMERLLDRMMTTIRGEELPPYTE